MMLLNKDHPPTSPRPDTNQGEGRERDLTVKCQILLTFNLTVNLTLNGKMLNLTGSGETGNRPLFGSFKAW